MSTSKAGVEVVGADWRILLTKIANGEFRLPCDILAKNGVTEAFTLVGIGLELVECSGGEGKPIVKEKVAMEIVPQPKSRGESSERRRILVPNAKRPLAFKDGRDSTGRRIMLTEIDR